MKMIIICFLFILFVDAVRVSPKLDFEDSSSEPAVRPLFDNEYVNGRLISSEQGVGIVCTSNHCNVTKTTSDKDNGVSADVVVHVATSLGRTIMKNETMENIPDIPIIVGTKSSNYPSDDLSPPDATNNGFVPSINLPHSNYPPQFQDNNRVFDNTYFTSSVNLRDLIYQDQRGTRTNRYNPVEFKYTYGNSWTPTWNTNKPSFYTRMGPAIPRWRPCICQNNHFQPYSPTFTYSSSNNNPGVSAQIDTLT